MSSRTRQLREENREAARFLSQASNAALDDITDRLRAVSITLIRSKPYGRTSSAC